MYGASRITICSRRYDEVLEGLKLELNARRAELVEKLWARVGGQGQGPGARVPLTAIAACFSANSHPSVKSRQRTEAEVLREFVVRFEHVCNKQDGTVTQEQFEKYFCTDPAAEAQGPGGDEYFALVMRAAWGIA